MGFTGRKHTGHRGGAAANFYGGGVLHIFLGGGNICDTFGGGQVSCDRQTDERTDKQTNRWTASSRKAPAVAAARNPLMGTRYYSATSNNIKLVYWPLMGGLLHLVQRGGDWAGMQPAQAPTRCTKCNSPPINGQCTNHRIAV